MALFTSEWSQLGIEYIDSVANTSLQDKCQETLRMLEEGEV